MRILPVALFLTACAGPVPITQKEAGGLGAGAGLATAAAAVAVKKAFTPDFKLNVYPSKFCELRRPHGIQCILVPCALEQSGKDAIQANCITLEPEDDFWSREVKVESLDTAGRTAAAIFNFCKKNTEACLYFSGKFQDQTLILEKK